MRPHTCVHHPAAATLGGCCAACLFETALTAEDSQSANTRHFTIQVPLGESHGGSVFLVRAESSSRLLRLKRVRAPAPPGFMQRFTELQGRLDAWREPAIVSPVAAFVDAAGYPSILTEFRQGMPLLDSVASGWLHPDAALVALRRLRDVIEAAHARGLAHGSIVAGNIFAGRPDGAPYLLDFGVAPLLSDGPEGSRWAEADLDGLAQIEAALQTRSSAPSNDQ